MKTATLKQIFKITPDIVIITKLLNCFNLSDLDDNRTFTKWDLIYYDTESKIMELIPELVYYYVPCKAKVYLYNLKMLTVLRHFLRAVNYTLARKESITKAKKIIYYTLQNDDNTVSYKIDHKPKIVCFN